MALNMTLLKSQLSKTIKSTKEGVKANILARQEASKQKIYQIGQEILTASQPLVPVDVGTLKSSGHVDKPVVHGENVSCKIGYGGAAEAYALRQHEDMTLKHPNGGQAKYLEQPFKERKKTVPEEIRTAMRLAGGKR